MTDMKTQVFREGDLVSDPHLLPARIVSLFKMDGIRYAIVKNWDGYKSKIKINDLKRYSHE